MTDLVADKPFQPNRASLKTSCPGDLEFLGSALRIGATTAVRFVNPLIGAGVGLIDRVIPGDPIDVIQKAASPECRAAHSQPKFIPGPGGGG